MTGPPVHAAGWRVVRSLPLAVLAAAALVGLAVFSVNDPKYALAGAAGAFGIGLAVFDRSVLPAMAVPGTLIVVRLGGSSTNLSVSDALLFVGTLSALPLLRARSDADLRFLLGLVATYEALVLIAVVYHPYRADFTEWVHEAFLTAGSLTAGWVVGHAGRARAALGAFLIGSSVISVWAVLYGLAHHLKPANLPLGLQKNFVGDLVAFAVLTALVNPTYLALSTRQRRYVAVICLAGIAASQSRQAVVGLAVATLVVMHRRGGIWRRSKPILLVIAIGLGYAADVLYKQLHSTNKFNSANQRLAWYHDSLLLLHKSPWLGEGLRWWYSNRFSFAFQPPNAELEMVTSAGIVGVIALVILHWGALARLRRIDASIGTFAFTALLMRVLQGQLDIFWVSAQSAIPWMIVGIVLGTSVVARSQASTEPRTSFLRQPYDRFYDLEPGGPTAASTDGWTHADGPTLMDAR